MNNSMVKRSYFSEIIIDKWHYMKGCDNLRVKTGDKGKLVEYDNLGIITYMLI